MKKFNSTTKIIVLTFILFSIVSNSISAEVPVWNYNENIVTGNSTFGNHGPFLTEEACKNDREKFLNSPLGLSSNSSLCISSTVKAYPVPQTTLQQDPPTVINSKKEDNIDLNNDTYKFLAPIGKETEVKTTNIGNYINTMIKTIIGLSAALAVVMIILAGIQWMGNESVFGKTEAKGKIGAAILGLVIALGSYAILNTINPDLLGKNGLSISGVNIEIEGDSNAPIGGIESLPSGILCIKGKENIPKIVQSFKDKITYQMGAKGVAGPSNTIKLDCSGFVNYVLRCAGVPFINSGTAVIFENAEKVISIQNSSINGKELAIGDLVGWRPDENSKIAKGKDFGHVMIYVGNGNVQVADSHGGSKISKALGIFPISRYQDRIKYIKRAQ